MKEFQMTYEENSMQVLVSHWVAFWKILRQLVTKQVESKAQLTRPEEGLSASRRLLD